MARGNADGVNEGWGAYQATYPERPSLPLGLIVPFPVDRRPSCPRRPPSNRFSPPPPPCAQIIEARYMMRSQFEWDRFMRFMDRYSADKGLGFEK